MPSDEELDVLIDAGAAVLGIPVELAWRGMIRMHLGITLRHALSVAEFSLPDEIDPAPVFRA